MIHEPGDTTAIEDPDEATGPAPGGQTSLVVHGREGARVLLLGPGVPLDVGRSPPADVVVADRNVSRRHARFEWLEDGVWVEDLGSTNGTFLNGARVDRARLGPGDEVTLGAASIALLVLSPADRALHSVASHERFLERLEQEVVRGREFRRPLAVAMIRSAAPRGGEVRRWLPRARQRLRPVDGVGLYGPDTVLVALPEAGPDRALELARGLVAEGRGAELRCGLAFFPEEATTAEGLVGLARTALREATATEPVRAAGRDAPPGAASPPGPIVVSSPRMERLHASIDRIARSSAPVIILGETGVGKDVLARDIHARGPRRDGPFRAVNCGGIPASLLESTLFGHERGAFTGADRRVPGLFEQASGGTVLLDEVGELSAGAQAALLRVLETKRLSRVGSAEEIEVDVRILAATHRNVEAMCDEGAFRWDLFFRLNTIVLEVPPLRERPEEIQPLADLFLAAAAGELGAPVGGFTEEARRLLARYQWPGNVRELKNVVERAVVLAEGDLVTAADLSERVRGPRAQPEAPDAPSLEGLGDLPLRDLVRRYEVELIVAALERCGGNQTEAAKLLQLPLRTLVHKLSAFGIRKKFE